MISKTLGRYLALTFLKNAFFFLLGLIALIYLFDTIELMRRAAKFDLPLTLVLQLGLFKIPEVLQTLFPFAIFFGAMIAFWQLNRRQEFIIARGAGFSVWQFLTPVMITAAAIGVLYITVLNPFGTVLLTKFDKLEEKYLENRNSQIALFKEGLWLRQPLKVQKPDGLEDGYIILHAEKINTKSWVLSRLKVLFFDEEDSFLQRIDARSATLDQGFWVLNDVRLFQPGFEGQSLREYKMATTLTIDEVEDSLAANKTISFWHLPAHINTVEETGFDATELKVTFQNLLSQPLFFTAMILLAACVSMRPPRMRNGIILIGSGIFIGFIVFFMASFFQALGASQQLPVILSAWSPALILTLFGLTTIIYLEDG